MTDAFLIYPHQLFPRDVYPSKIKDFPVYLIEDPLFFKQYPFHKKKLLMHRATMKAYEGQLKKGKVDTHYINAFEIEHTADVAERLKKDNLTSVHVFTLVDDWLEQRLRSGLKEKDIEITVHHSPGFLTAPDVEERCFAGKQNFYFSSFYQEQRRDLGLLLNDSGGPEGGKWSYDPENRKKLPKEENPPAIPTLPDRKYLSEAKEYVKEHFDENYGELTDFEYPITSADAEVFLDQFIEDKIKKYGPYQDAIDLNDSFLYHSALSQAINCGFLLPRAAIDKVIAAGEDGRRKIPLQSVEGFVRQVIGWREYVKILYMRRGRKQRSQNYFGNKRSLPESMWNGTTGITPVDDVIKRLLRTGYSNHIERLMVLSNFMLLCEIDPNEVYEWFMTLYIDAYDWVMVPNVYGMGQFADGGSMMTKPYISSSNYIRKMSHYKKGEWCEIWDGLYWRFIDKHKEVFKKNNRMSFMVSQLERMSSQKRKAHKEVAANFLKGFR